MLAMGEAIKKKRVMKTKKQAAPAILGEDYSQRADSYYQPQYGDPILSVRISPADRQDLEELFWILRINRADIARVGIHREIQRLKVIIKDGGQDLVRKEMGLDD